ncbi:MAG: helix-turn-helix transcriptional regulator [Mogibacterium sp.]|nr:helix-turn-helix transcriptional regulator [Mogibacterium sp.]
MPRHRNSNTERNISPWAKKIRDLRLDNDLTQQAVADHLNVSQRVYADYELGNVRIPVEHLLRLSYFYRVSMDYLCERNNDASAQI